MGHGPGYNLPPVDRLMAPGPGVAGPGPGVLTSAEMPIGPSGDCYDDGGVTGIGGMMPSAQVLFTKLDGMQVVYDSSGSGTFDSAPIITPGRANFQQGGLYRLKVTNIPDREGIELYPTLEIGRATPRTVAFLAHNAIPVQLTVDDFSQVVTGNFVTKVIYLPDPEFQDLAVAGVETLVSTRLDPGVDPIVEADRRGAILAVLRVGNKNIEMPGMMNEAGAGVVSALACLDGGAGGVAQAGGAGMSGGHMGMPGYVAGVSTAAYGMPITGTPIGLPGPPHIPLGAPAGLQKHVIHNRTHTYIPDPTDTIRINVKQHPRVSYPAPRDRAWISEYNNPTCGPHVGAQPQ
ncbi:MAG: hypothetical protein R3E01_28720 [Pirellulaceae bacterium]